MTQRTLVVTIDTEADNLWSRPRSITTANLRALPRFQSICEKYGFLPTYLISPEVCSDKDFVAVAKRWRNMGLCEIGAHPHAWLCPPEYELTGADFYNQPLLIEYPREIMEAKICTTSRYLADQFETAIRSHRAGRWGVNTYYFELLGRYGFTHDSSITPHIRWTLYSADGVRRSVIDYRDAPENPYLAWGCGVDERVGLWVIEVPVTIRPKKTFKNILKKALRRLPIAFSSVCYECVWLRPNGNNLSDILSLVSDGKNKVLVFALHSSEMMAGGSPYFKNKESVERLFNHVEEIFKLAHSMNIRGAFLSDVRESRAI